VGAVRPERVGDLEIAEDMSFQWRGWMAQRAGWVFMLAIIFAALLGLCGSDGPLNRASAGTENDEISIRYARFLRHMSPTTLEIETGAGAVDGGYVRVAIAHSYLERFEVDSVTPEPESVQLEPGTLIYNFPAAGTDGTRSVVFVLRPDAYGRLSGRIGTPGGPFHEIQQFVYP
jgi:hypothetical protein